MASKSLSGGGATKYTDVMQTKKTAPASGSKAPSDGLANLGRNKKKAGVLVVVSLARCR